MRITAAVLLSTLLVLPAEARRRPAPSRAKPCATMSELTLFMTAIGLRAGCDAASASGCDLHQPIQLSVHPFAYDFGCAPHTLRWDFGDGTTASTTGRVVEHQYVVPGTYAVSATVTNDRETFVVRRAIHVVTPGF